MRLKLPKMRRRNEHTCPRAEWRQRPGLAALDLFTARQSTGAECAEVAAALAASERNEPGGRRMHAITGKWPPSSLPVGRGLRTGCVVRASGGQAYARVAHTVSKYPLLRDRRHCDQIEETVGCRPRISR